MKKFFLDGFVALATLLIIFSLVMPVRAETPPTLSPDTTLPNDLPDITPPPDVTEQLPPQIAANVSPVITVWYENSLKFGQLGNPQRQVNILGNISDPDSSISSLSYTLDTGPSITLSIGPDGYRLVNKGDFNISIDTVTTNLTSGNHTVVITGKDSGGATTVKTVIFQYTKSLTWPIPYTTNWASAGAINNQAQVVDGKWAIVSNGVRVIEQGYDRLIAIGDMSWKDYEILVPITVYAFYPDPKNTADAGGVGVIARWQGHTGSGVLPSDWRSMGAYGYYSNRDDGLAMWLNGTYRVTQNFSFQLGTTYLFKLRAETVPNVGGKYSLKAWVKGQPEPAWDANSNIVGVVDSNGDLPMGSILLVAHRADALFGDVTICPFNVSYGLKVNINGSGTVTTSPNKSSFACGEGVTLTPAAAPGWVFKNWSGDISSTSPALSFNMIKAYNLTANFERSGVITLGSNIFLPFVRR